MNPTQSKKVVAITGGSRGIGKAIAEAFFAHGYRVAVCSRAARDATLSSEIFHQRVDVRRRQEQQQFVAAILEYFGTLDVFVNCAGISRWRSIADVDEAFAAEIMETNVMGTLWGCAAAAQFMPSGSAIINVSSLAGKRGSANNSVYCASKFAVNGITQSLAKELGPRGIRVNAVCPVYVETPHIMESLAEPASPAQGEPVATYLAHFAATQTALGRLPTPDDVANAVVFLASPNAAAITGQCVNVDCGVLPQ